MSRLYRSDRSGWEPRDRDAARGFVRDGDKASCPRGCGKTVRFYGGHPEVHRNKSGKANCI